MKEDKIVIELEKKRLFQYLAVIAIVFLVCIVSFAASNANSEKYSKNTSNNNIGNEEDILQIATKDAGEVKDEERVAPHEISTDDYLNIYGGSDEYTEEEVEDYITRIKELRVEYQINNLTEKMKNTLDLEEKKRIASRIENMKKEVLKW